MTKKATDIIAYLTIIGWLLSFFIGTREESKFHLNQALIINVVELAAALVGVIPFVGGIIASIVGLVCLGFAVFGIVNAYNEQEKELPFVGGIQILK